MIIIILTQYILSFVVKLRCIITVDSIRKVVLAFTPILGHIKNASGNIDWDKNGAILWNFPIQQIQLV